jgi:uncharacterized membrane protein
VVFIIAFLLMLVLTNSLGLSLLVAFIAYLVSTPASRRR